MRALTAILGAAALLWGAYLAVDLLAASTRDGVQVVAFLVGGPIAHDLVVAPLIGLAGLLTARRVPPPWRGPVARGATATGVLALLAVPLLWRPFGVPENPGLHDRDYGTGLAVAVSAVWALVVVAGIVRSRRERSGTFWGR